MIKTVIIFLKYLLYWLIYFWVSKLVFLLANYSLSSNVEFIEFIKIFLIGTKMDLSMAAYLTVLPGLILAVSFLFSTKILNVIFKIYTVIILMITTFLNVLDLALFPHWGTRVGINAFNYVGDFKGVISNITIWNSVTAITVYLLFFILFLLIYNKFVKIAIQKSIRLKWYFSPVLLFLTVFLSIPIRGSFGTSPMNLSMVSFSDKLYVNQAASNYLWNFFNSVERRKSYENPCNYTESENAWQIFNTVESQRVNSDTLIIQPNIEAPPNVLLIVLESFSNKVISSFGGDFNVSPNLDYISANGIIFPSFYASGNRSDRGISALLGGYPSLLEMSIMRFPDKSNKITVISDYFNRHNYESSFYYGGDIDFYSLKSFLLQGKYAEIISQDDFPGELQSLSKWGVPDGYLFDRVLHDIKLKTKPFFTVAYTLSSHPPYDVPFDKIKGNSDEAKYLNSVAYTDSCVGEFIKGFKKTDYWENTLVVITADHGALQPGPTEIIEPASYRIPLIFTGGVIKNRGVVNNICGQPDFIPTLIHQLGWETDSVLFGHDLFSSPSYAFYMLDNGWGFVNNNGEYYYDQITGDFKSFNQKEISQSEAEFAKAYLQVLHEDFLLK